MIIANINVGDPESDPQTSARFGDVKLGFC